MLRVRSLVCALNDIKALSGFTTQHRPAYDVENTSPTVGGRSPTYQNISHTW